jgi:hypothetical protein
LPRHHRRAHGRLRFHPDAAVLARPNGWRQVHEIDTEINEAPGIIQALPNAFSAGLYRMVTDSPSLCVRHDGDLNLRHGIRR